MTPVDPVQWLRERAVTVRRIASPYSPLIVAELNYCADELEALMAGPAAGGERGTDARIDASTMAPGVQQWSPPEWQS